MKHMSLWDGAVKNAEVSSISMAQDGDKASKFLQPLRGAWQQRLGGYKCG